MSRPFKRCIQITILVLSVLGFRGLALAQDVFTKNRGFPATYELGGPTTAIDGSVRVPGMLELNSCVRFSDASGNNCLCRDDATNQVWSEIDCDGVYEGAPDEFFLGTGGTGGGSKIITDANSEANAQETGDGNAKISTWCEGGQCFQKCTIGGSPCPPGIIIPTGMVLNLENEAGTHGIAISSDWNVTLTGNARESESAWISAGAFSTDGTLCATPTEVTFGSNKMWTVVCADNDSSRLMYTMGMDFRWDGGPIEIIAYVASNAATPSGDYDIDWSIACGGTLSGTIFGAEAATDFDFDAGGSCGGGACPSTAPASAESGPITPGGTCTKGGIVRIRGEIDATGTTATNVHFLGINLRRVADDWSE